MPTPPREFLPTYNFINSELEIIACNLADIVVNTDFKITFKGAQKAHLHLIVILRHYIVAARAAAAELPPSTPPPTPSES